MSALTLSWNATGAIDSYSVYRSTSPIDASNLPAPVATGLTTKQFVDDTVEDGLTYYYRVASVSNDRQKISAQATIVAQGSTLKARVFKSLATGTALANASITLVIDEDPSAQFTKTGNAISGTAKPNAQITITIGD